MDPITYPRLSHSKALPIALIMLLSVIILPHRALSASGADALEFPVTDRAQLSMLVTGSDLHEPYVPSKRSMRVVVTSYNSVPEQTDSTPFTTASGTTCRDGVVAANFLRIGTKVRFPDLFGSKTFVVEDRMNERFSDRIDIWSADLAFSRQFGTRYLRVEIL